MRTVLSVIGAAFVFATSAASQEMSDKAQEVLDAYRVQLCEQSTEDLRDEWPEGYVPTFDYDETVYRKVRLARDGAAVELIYSSGMTCDGKRLGTCGSGGCSGHIIFNGHDYETFGGPLFLLHPEAGSGGETLAVIAWAGYGGYCRSQKNPETENVRDCLLTAFYDDWTKRLVFPVGYEAGLPEDAQTAVDQ